VRVQVAGDGDAFRWFVRWRDAGRWQSRLAPASLATLTLIGGNIDGVAVAAVDRVGNASPDAVWRR
ncbi:MAG: hypothetical protein RI891_380, partial [Gemmatimonadota bacterium]